MRKTHKRTQTSRQCNLDKLARIANGAGQSASTSYLEMEVIEEQRKKRAALSVDAAQREGWTGTPKG